MTAVLRRRYKYHLMWIGEAKPYPVWLVFRIIRLLKLLGRYDRAEDCLREAAEILERSGSENILAECLELWGDLLIRRGRLNEAERLLLQAEHIFSRIGDEKNLAMVKADLGRIYRIHGEFSKAEEYFRYHLDYSCRLEDHSEKSIALENLAQVINAVESSRSP